MEGVTPRGVGARRPPGARQPHADLRPEPHLHRGRHQHLVLRGRGEALRGLRLGRAHRRLAQEHRRRRGRPPLRRGRRRPARRDRGRQEGHQQAVHRRAQDDHRVARADQAEHRQVARLRARRRRDLRHQGAARASPTSRSPSSGPSSPTPARSAPAARPRTRPGTSATRPGARPTPTRRRCSTGSSPGELPAGLARPCRASPPTPSRACPPAPPPARCSARSPTSCPSCGAARPTSPSPTTRRWSGQPSFIPTGKQTEEWQGGPGGRTLHFGIREFGMGCILNGIALEGLTRPYGGTFLVFSDYMRGAVRLAAIQGIPVTFVWTHDSIGLGEDGPTHQPVEHLAALRAMPGPRRRPTGRRQRDRRRSGAPSSRTPARPGLVLTRQNLPIWDRTHVRQGEQRQQGRLRPRRRRRRRQRSRPTSSSSPPAPRCSIAVDARETLEKAGIRTRVVSMPCREWFERQTKAYREKVLPAGGPRTGQHRGRRRPRLARLRRRRRADHLARALRGLGRLPDPVPRVRDHAGGHRARRPRTRIKAARAAATVAPVDRGQPAVAPEREPHRHGAQEERGDQRLRRRLRRRPPVLHHSPFTTRTTARTGS